MQRTSHALDTLINTLPIGIGVAEDRDCRDIRVNRAFADLLGINQDANASLSAPAGERPAFTVLVDGKEVPPEDLPMQFAARVGREVGPYECEVVRPDGRRVALYEYAAPLFDEDSRVRGAIGVFVDISERRRVEQEQRLLARAGEILSSSLDYEATLSALAQLVVPLIGDFCAVDVVREDGTLSRVEFVVADPRLQDIADGLKRYAPQLSLDTPAAQVMRTGVPLVAAECQPDLLERIAHNAEHHELLTRLGMQSYLMAPLTARGRSLGLVTIGSLGPARRFGEADLNLGMEIGRRAALALDNARLYRLAQEANRLKDDFLATLSHELRTPLNALLGWTHLLKTRASDEAFRTRALDSIERNAQAQAVLIDDLLDVSRVISGKLTLAATRLDVGAVLLAAVDSIRPTAHARELELTVSVAPLSGEVVGDRDRLRQVFWNLLSNAVKFTPPHGRVDVSAEQRGGAVQITVSDTGVGIDREFLPHVFERFRQADTTTTRNHGGLGLGLAIVRHLVDLHGGAVMILSDGAGTGTRVVVTLPLRSAEDAEPRESRDHATVVLRGIHVLVVDDDVRSRGVTLLMLQEAGADVMAVGPAAALDAVETFNPAVVVVDIDRDSNDAERLLEHLATRDGGPQAIAVTVIADSGGAPAGSPRPGIAMQIVKPIDYNQLVDAIARLAAVGNQAAR